MMFFSFLFFIAQVIFSVDQTHELMFCLEELTSGKAQPNPDRPMQVSRLAADHVSLELDMNNPRAFVPIHLPLPTLKIAWLGDG